MCVNSLLVALKITKELSHTKPKCLQEKGAGLFLGTESSSSQKENVHTAKPIVRYISGFRRKSVAIFPGLRTSSDAFYVKQKSLFFQGSRGSNHRNHSLWRDKHIDSVCVISITANRGETKVNHCRYKEPMASWTSRIYLYYFHI